MLGEKAQTSTEFLVVLAAVLAVALLFVASLSSAGTEQNNLVKSLAKKIAKHTRGVIK